MEKIDIHCHTTNRVLGNTGECNADLKTIERRMIDFDISRTVVLASYFPHKTSGISNFRLSSWLNRRRDKFLMFGSLDFENYFYQGYNELEELADKKKISGIKIYTGYQKIDLSGEKFGQVVNLAKQYDFPLMFHTGYSFQARRLLGGDSVEEIVRASDLEFLSDSGINVIFSHLGKPNFEDTVEVCKNHNNFYADMSGLVSSRSNYKNLYENAMGIRKFLYFCGTKKLLFGTDFPVQTHVDSVNMIEKAMEGYSDLEKSDVYFGNAAKILGVDYE